MSFSAYIKKLSDINYLPSLEEVRFEYDQMIKNRDYIYVSAKDIWHEIITKELVEQLAIYLGPYWNVLEVGAWNGKLWYHLEKTRQKLYNNMCMYHAVDIWREHEWPNSSMIEKISDKEWIEKYQPDIIIAANLAKHPYYLLPKNFREQRSILERKTITHDETIWKPAQEELKSMEVLLSAKEKELDMTYYWRQYQNIKEYILIWSVWKRWSLEQTFWLKENINFDGKLKSFDEISSPSFIKDWFIKTQLNIPTINREEFICGSSEDFVWWRDTSKVYSFKRDKFI